MSVKPELTLSCLKESRRYQFSQCPIGTFIVRLYWKDYSEYVRNERKLDGVYLLKDSGNRYHRVCEFAITSLESLEYLIANCNPATGVKGNWFKKQTEYALMKFRGFAQTTYQFVKPIKTVVQSVVSQVKQTASKAVETVVHAAKSNFRRFDPRQPQSFAKCVTLEQAKYLFDRCPNAQKTQAFIDNYLAACNRISPQAQPIPYVSMFNVADLIAAKNIRPVPAATNFNPCYDKNGDLIGWIPMGFDDIAPAHYVPEEGKVSTQNTDIVDSPIEESEYRKLLRPVLDFKKPHAFLKQIGLQTGTVIGGVPRASKDLFEKVVKNCFKNQVPVSQLRDIIAAG
jgi:hypothetical protein